MMARVWTRVGMRFLPFADAASPELPLPRLLRLSLFQIGCGLSVVLLMGTLNRVMIVELGLPAGLVGLMVAIPLLLAPVRVFVGHRSDHHASVLGWRRVPYLWFGTLMQFGGFAILPFALLVMTGGGQGPAWPGEVAALLAFLLVGLGLHTVQTAGLALATDLGREDRRPRIVALLYVMLLVGMLLASMVIGQLLLDFSPTRLVQVVQGVALLTLILNMTALWKQEPRQPGRIRPGTPRPALRPRAAAFLARAGTRRLLLAIGLGAAGFAMQDILLEPYGAEVLGMGVGETTRLTGLWAAGTLIALAHAAHALARSALPLQLAARGLLTGVIGLAMVVLAAPTDMVPLILLGVLAIGFGGGLFGVGTLAAAMALGRSESETGLALGCWGAAHAASAGAAMLLAGILRDALGLAAGAGALGRSMAGEEAPYIIIWHLEIALLFATLVAIGPLVRRHIATPAGDARPFGLREFPA